MTADMEANKKRSHCHKIVFINISLVFVSQSYFKLPKTIRLNGTHYFIMKILKKRKLQQIASNHSSDFSFKDFMKLCKDYTKESFLFLVNSTTLSAHNALIFKETLL